MAWRDWINSGGLFGGYGDYGSGLDQSALQRANKYGMAAAAATLMKSDPYDTRYGTKLFGSLLAGKMAMRDQLAEQQEMLAKRQAAAALAARQEQEWEWKKAEAERKDREWWEKESTPEVGGGVDDEIASANLWAEKTGKDPSIFLGLPKVAQVAEMKKLTEAPEVPEEFIEGGSRWIRGADGRLQNLGFIPKRPDEEKGNELTPEEILRGVIPMLREQVPAIDPVTKQPAIDAAGNPLKEPKYTTPQDAVKTYLDTYKSVNRAVAPKPPDLEISNEDWNDLKEELASGREETKLIAAMILDGKDPKVAARAVSEAKKAIR